jgi:oligopeptide/dipeptide ABC transporter ATP-binding protein
VNVLDARSLEKAFVTRRNLIGRPVARIVAVNGVSLTVAAGETLGLVGESGSGKSTVARLVTRLIEPDAGDVNIDGTNWLQLGARELRRARRTAQMVFQDPYASLDPTKTILDVVGEPLVIHDGLRGPAKEDRVGELLDMVGLPRAHARRYPYEFSGGQRQRIAIARALAPKPKLVVADEAVSALDVSTQAQVLNLLLDLQDQQELAYLFISHDLGVVRQMSDRIAVMYLGRIVEEGPAEAIYEEPSHPYTRALLSSVPEIDPRRRKERLGLKGDPPESSGPVTGCPFHPRCSEAMGICAEQEPPTTVAASGVSVSCHLLVSTEQPVRIVTHPTSAAESAI